MKKMKKVTKKKEQKALPKPKVTKAAPKSFSDKIDEPKK